MKTKKTLIFLTVLLFLLSPVDAQEPLDCNDNFQKQEINNNFFTNYGNYMPRVNCLLKENGDPDWAWIIPIILLTVGIIVGYSIIFTFWRKCYLLEEPRDRNVKLMDLAYIFFLCAMCGYVFSILVFFLPMYRLLALFLVGLNFITWKFITNLQNFKSSFEMLRMIREATEKLQETKEELDDFIYSASHDLKSPLIAISHLVDFMRDNVKENDIEGFEKNYQTINRRIERLRNMITSILEYSSLDKNLEHKDRYNFSKLENDLRNLVTVPDDTKLTITGFNEILELEIVRLHQVIRNLMSNAIKFNDKEIVKIDIDIQKKDNKLFFKITDNGIGIEEKYYSKIFKSFETINTKDKYNSNGLGLYIVQKAIKHNGGEISVSSVFGKTTTFEFTWII